MTLTVLYSFNKKGLEARYWEREIAAASTDNFRFIPFNHDPYLDTRLYIRAQLLDNLYYKQHAGLMALYRDLERVIEGQSVDVLVVDNCPPYHPDYLRNISLYKILRIGDGPISAYDRDFAYLHAYDHVLYHSPAYSRDMDMAEKLRYCRAKNIDFWPMALFDAAFDSTKTEDTLFAHERDIDVIFIGSLHLGKMPLLAAVKRAFRRRFRVYGLSPLKANLYFNMRFGLPGWIQPIPFDQYVPLYQRTKIGINIHNRGKYTVGNYRLFDLAGNGVMQISDGDHYLDRFFQNRKEIVSFSNADDLIDRIHYYLAHDNERQSIARSAFRRAMKDHRFVHRMRQLGELIAGAIGRRSESGAVRISS